MAAAAGGGAGNAPGAGAQGAQAAQGSAAAATPGAPREKRKDPGSDLIVRNLVSGEETTIAEVSDYQWKKDGSWLVYGVSAAKPEGDGAFARKMSDGSVTTLLKGHGNYRNLAFDEAGTSSLLLSDQAEYEKEVSPYRRTIGKPGDAQATRTRVRGDGRHA